MQKPDVFMLFRAGDLFHSVGGVSLRGRQSV